MHIVDPRDQKTFSCSSPFGRETSTESSGYLSVLKKKKKLFKKKYKKKTGFIKGKKVK